MTETRNTPRKDWAGNLRAYTLAWGVPTLAIVAGSLIDEYARTVIWIGALVWMGTACLLNARRCGRTHCRFTGPFYLVTTVPVLLHGSGVFQLGPNGWGILGAAILFGGAGIWWLTEAIWGKFAASQ